MPIQVRVGDLFESQAQTLVNTVNCVGVMGRGIALGFRKRFPEMFEDYADRCEAGEIQLGYPYLFKGYLAPWILNFPTKDHWRSVARLEDIVAGLDHLEAHYRTWGITSLAVPPLGCGEGKLEWRIVGRELYRRLTRLNIPVELFAPHGTADAELEDAFLAGSSDGPDGDRAGAGTRRIPAGWFGIAAIVERLSTMDADRGVGRIVLQKAAYLATVDGVPTGLTFEADSYGPFAPGLKQVTSTLVNNGVLIEERDGRAIRVRPGRSYADAKRVFETQSPDWSRHIDRVANLLGACSSREAEVLATALFAWRSLAAVQIEPPSPEAVIESAIQWRTRRVPPVEAVELGGALRRLEEQGWLENANGEQTPSSPRDVAP